MPDDLLHLRRKIDDLDHQVAELLAARRQVSRRIQELRREAGGGPVDQGRERIVHESYVSVLGEPGSAVAAAVLDACRPRVASA